MTTADWAQAVLAAQDAATMLARPTQAAAPFSEANGYAVAHAVRELRVGRGERPRGYKIGFTNRTIWETYGVHAPIWGPVWTHTLQWSDTANSGVSVRGLVQPRLEPEIVFGFGTAPRPGMDESALARCIDWVAHGVEIVHTHYEGWRFGAADAVADGALHGRLIVGPQLPLSNFKDPAGELAALELQLWCDGRCMDRGRGSHVLDGPMNAVRVWFEAMATQPCGWDVRPGDVVTTGTLTDAWPIRVGDRWHTSLSDRRLHGLHLEIVP